MISVMMMRTRVVDDGTEFLLNLATWPIDATKHDGLKILVAMIILFLRAFVMPKMWKRGVNRALRELAIYFRHLQFAWTVFMLNSKN